MVEEQEREVAAEAGAGHQFDELACLLGRAVALHPEPGEGVADADIDPVAFDDVAELRELVRVREPDLTPRCGVVPDTDRFSVFAGCPVGEARSSFCLNAS